MGDFDTLDDLEREPTEEEMRADRAANVREYFRAKRSGEDFKFSLGARRMRRLVWSDMFDDMKELTSTFSEEKSLAVREAEKSLAAREAAVESVFSSTTWYLSARDAFV